MRFRLRNHSWDIVGVFDLLVRNIKSMSYNVRDRFLSIRSGWDIWRHMLELLGTTILENEQNTDSGKQPVPFVWQPFAN